MKSNKLKFTLSLTPLHIYNIKIPYSYLIMEHVIWYDTRVSGETSVGFLIFNRHKLPLTLFLVGGSLWSCKRKGISLFDMFWYYNWYVLHVALHGSCWYTSHPKSQSCAPIFLIITMPTYTMYHIYTIIIEYRTYYYIVHKQGWVSNEFPSLFRFYRKPVRTRNQQGKN